MTSDLINTPQALSAACLRLSKAPMLAFDTEFIRESTYFPILALIQIASADAIFLIDPVAISVSDMQPLLTLLTDPKILKIMHSAQADQECLWTHYQILAAPLFDTSIAASLLGFGDQIGLAKLIEQLRGVTINKDHTRTNWLARPLQPALLDYAREDVAHLIPIAQQLQAKLSEEGRGDWAAQLFAEWTKPARFTPNAVSMAQKMSKRKRLDAQTLSLLAALISWRETTAQQMNIPRKRVADDQALLDLANVRPKTSDHLRSFRGIHRGILSTHEPELLRLCLDTTVLPELATPPPQQRKRESVEEKLLVELFQYFVKVVAIQHRLSSRHLLERDAAEQIAFGKFTDSADWVSAGLLSADVHGLIGATLWDFLQGRSQLAIQDGQIIICRQP